MSGALRSSSTSIILILAFSIISNHGNAAEKKAAVFGTPFLVAVADGQKDYIHKNLLKVADETPAQAIPTPAPSQKATVTEAKAPVNDVTPSAAAIPASQSPTVAPPKAGESSKTATPPTPAAVAPQRAPEAKSQSILQMIEGHEAEVKIAALVAALAFVLGWFCGGSYYLRRERKARHKLRF